MLFGPSGCLTSFCLPSVPVSGSWGQSVLCCVLCIQKVPTARIFHSIALGLRSVTSHTGTADAPLPVAHWGQACPCSCNHAGPDQPIAAGWHTMHP
jgi:hypothetical protein